MEPSIINQPTSFGLENFGACAFNGIIRLRIFISTNNVYSDFTTIKVRLPLSTDFYKNSKV